MNHGRGSTGELRGNRLIVIGDNACIAEQPPCQGNRGRIGQGSQKGWQTAVAHMDIDEFVNIQWQDPVGLLQQRMCCGLLEGGKLDARPVIGGQVGQVNQPAGCGQMVQHPVRSVLTVI